MSERNMMSKTSAADQLRARLGMPERPPASESTEASSGAEGSSEAEASTEAEPMSMNDLIRARPRRHVDLFGQPPSRESPDEPSEGMKKVPTQTPQEMNALIRAHRQRSDEPPAETSSDERQ
jgi:hypothetical protein